MWCDGLSTAAGRCGCFLGTTTGSTGSALARISTLDSLFLPLESDTETALSESFFALPVFALTRTFTAVFDEGFFAETDIFFAALLDAFLGPPAGALEAAFFGLPAGGIEAVFFGLPADFTACVFFFGVFIILRILYRLRAARTNTVFIDALDSPPAARAAHSFGLYGADFKFFDTAHRHPDV